MDPTGMQSIIIKCTNIAGFCKRGDLVKVIFKLSYARMFGVPKPLFSHHLVQVKEVSRQTDPKWKKWMCPKHYSRTNQCGLNFVAANGGAERFVLPPSNELATGPLHISGMKGLATHHVLAKGIPDVKLMSYLQKTKKHESASAPTKKENKGRGSFSCFFLSPDILQALGSTNFEVSRAQHHRSPSGPCCWWKIFQTNPLMENFNRRLISFRSRGSCIQWGSHRWKYRICWSPPLWNWGLYDWEWRLLLLMHSPVSAFGSCSF